MEIMTLYVMNVAGSASHQSLKDLPKSLAAGIKLVHIYVSDFLYNSETIITPDKANVSCNQAEKCPETVEDKCKAYADCALTTSMTSLFALGIYKRYLHLDSAT
jgi:hypothetical protein